MNWKHQTLTTMIVALAVIGPALNASADDDQIRLHPKGQRLTGYPQGPYANLADGSVLAVDSTVAQISTDQGKTWQSHPLFADADKFLARPERALIRTRQGTLVMGFLNEKEITRGKWIVNDKKELSKFYLPTYITRSLDEGKTWETPQKIQDGWCGAIRSLIQLKSGRLVLAGQDVRFDPGRHVVMSYVSDDEGATWRPSHNELDIGGSGSHGGAMEATVAELADGRVCMLIRTVKGWFWEAFSDDGGLTWRDFARSKLRSSTCCGQLARLSDGRLTLLWNRSPVGKPYNLNSRAELSIAFSSDEAQTWSKPVVVSRRELQEGEKYYAARQSYPYVFEPRPGELWITTMQGGLRMKINTADVPDEPWPEAVKIVALGSSTTAPRGAVPVYCDRLDVILRDRGLAVEIVNSGVGSSTTEHSLKRFNSDVLDHDPDLVIIMLGGNDAAIDVWKNPPASKPRVAKQRYAENLLHFVKTLKERNVKVILMSAPPFRWTEKLKQLYGKPPYDVNDPWGFSIKLAEYSDVVRAVASEEDVPLIDAFKAFEEYDRVDGQSVDDLFLDGMHPNGKGHALIAELLTPLVQEACK